jgi:hypothetical protein
MNLDILKEFDNASIEKINIGEILRIDSYSYYFINNKLLSLLNRTNPLYLRNLRKLSDNKTFFIFEDELSNNRLRIIDKIKHTSQRNTSPAIYARHCTIYNISSTEKRNFLQSNHIQGDCQSSINYGAYYYDYLIAVMTFCKPRVFMGTKHTTSGHYELARFATCRKFRSIGVASKLLKHFINNNSFSEIYSYADARWGFGNMYSTIGFNLSHWSKPEYYYLLNGSRLHRWNFRKSELKKRYPEHYSDKLTEFQITDSIGIDRIYDCGTYKFIMKGY